jgi:O-antigen/teichoic acid export membrane protein
MSLKRSLAWMGAAQGILAVLQFASSVILARYLTPYETGIYGIALATVGVLSLVQSLGLQALLVREEEITPEITSTAFAVNAAIAVLLSALIFGASFLGGQALHEVGVHRVMLVIALTPLFGIFNFLPAAMLERTGNFRSLAMISTIAGLVLAVATIALAVAGFSYMSIAWAQCLSSLTSVVLTNLLGRQHVSYRIGFSAWRRIASFGLQMAAVNGITAASQRLSELSLGRLLGLSALGLFNRASGISAIVWNNVHMIVGRVMLVDFAQMHRSGISLRDRYIQVTTMMTALLWPAFGGLAVVGRPFIYYVYGAKWVSSYGALIFICIASMGLVASTMTWELFAATGNMRTQTRIEFIRALVSLIAFVGGCFISLEAAAASRVFDAVFAFLLYRPHLNRMTQTSLRDFVPVYGQGLALTLVAVAPAFVLQWMTGFAPDASLPPLIAAIVLGIVLWLGALLLTGHPLLREVRTTVAARYLRRA